MLCWVVGMFRILYDVHEVTPMGAFLEVIGVGTGVIQFCWAVDLDIVWDVNKGVWEFRSEWRTGTGGCDTVVFVKSTNIGGCWSKSNWKASVSCFSLSSVLSISSINWVRPSLIFNAACVSSSSSLIFRCSFASSICFFLVTCSCQKFHC